MNSIRFARQLKGLIKQSLISNNLRKHSILLNNKLNNVSNLNKLTALNINQKLSVQTDSDKDLTQFLTREIELEKQNTKAPKLGSRIPGFDVEQDGANLRLLRKFGDEQITIKLNVNGVVDTDETSMDQLNQGGNQEEPPLPEMKARPDFSIEIKKSGDKTLVLNCSYFAEDEEEELANEQTQEPNETKGDLFQIDNFYIVGKDDIVDKDDWRDNIYMGDGSLVDGEMYDLLMNYLDERGIGNEFAQNLMDYCTNYEHNQYIKLLDNLKMFVESK